MSISTFDSFTDSNATALLSHTGEIGATWSKNSAYPSAAPVLYWGRPASGSGGLVHPSGVPSGSDYSVAADFVCHTDLSVQRIFARSLTTELTGYCLEYASGTWTIKRYVSGSPTTLATYVSAIPVGRKIHGRIKVSGSSPVQIDAYLDGVSRLSYSDSSGSRLATGVPGMFPTPNGQVIGIQLDNFSVEDSADDHIRILELPANSIVQAATPLGSTSPVTIRGVYSGSPGGIEVRLVLASDGTTVVQNWTALTSLTMSNGFFSGALNVPNGQWVLAQVRFSGGAGASFNGVNRFGVGLVVATAGQSNIANWWSFDCGQTADDRVWTFDANGWRATASVFSGCAALAFGKTIADATGLLVGILDYGSSGTALLAETNAGTNWLNAADTSLQGKLKHGVFEVGGVDCTLWIQGEADAKLAADTITELDYKTGLDSFFSSFRASIGDSNHPIHIVPLSTDSSATLDDQWQRVRNAQLAKIAEPNCYFGGTGHDLPMSGVHYTTASYPVLAVRCARAILRRLGVSGGGYGPHLSGATKVSDTVYDVTITHDTGTDFTPSSGITGFEVFDGTTPVTINSAVRQSATSIRLTLASAVQSPSIYYPYGMMSVVTNVVKDNSANALPMWPSPVITAAALAVPMLTAPSGTPTGQTTATLTVTTDTAEGVADVVVTTSATKPSAAQIQAGTDHTGVAAAYHGQQAVTASGVLTFSATGLTAATAYYAHFTHEDLAGNDAAVVYSAAFTTEAPPHVNTPPTGSVTISGTPTQGQTLTASNTLSDVDGLGTITYTWRANGTIVGTGTTYVLQAGDVGDTITVTASYTDGYGEAESVTSAPVGPVDSASTKGLTITLHSGAVPQAAISDIVALWWDATTPSGAPAYSTTTASTDEYGVLALDLGVATTLSIGDSGFLLLYKLDATDHRNSLVFAGRVAVSDMA